MIPKAKTDWSVTILCDAVCEGLGEPTAVVGKNDDEIVLPDFTKNVKNQEIINRTSFTKGAIKDSVVPEVESNKIAE